MSAITDKTLEVALFLLPLFFLLRITWDYAQAAALGQPQALFSALYEAVALLLLLICYAQILEAIDLLVDGIIRAMRDRNKLITLLRCIHGVLDHPVSSFINLLKRFFTFKSLLFTRGFLAFLRGYLLIFSTAVGPLALAASILPGHRVFFSWLSMHCSFLCWGITMAVLDFMITLVGYTSLTGVMDIVRDWIGAQAFAAMYLFVAPLTSLYMGHRMSNGLALVSSMIMQRSLLEAIPNAMIRIGKAIERWI